VFELRSRLSDLGKANVECALSGRGLCVFTPLSNEGDADILLNFEDILTNMDEAVNWISNSLPALKGLKAPRLMDREFDWLASFEYQLGEELVESDQYPDCPVAGLDPIVRKLFKIFGTSVSGDINAVKTSKIFRDVTSDPKWPSVITDDEIFREVTKPGVAGDIHRMTLTLVAMGADPQKASRAAIKMERLVSKFVFVNKTDSYSSLDDIISQIQLSRKVYAESVTVPPFPNVLLRQVLESIGFLGIVTRPGGVYHKMRILVDGSEWMKTEKVLKGRFGENISLLNTTIFPRMLI
jgi:hypothetical protein